MMHNMFLSDHVHVNSDSPVALAFCGYVAGRLLKNDEETFILRQRTAIKRMIPRDNKSNKQDKQYYDGLTDGYFRG